MLSTGPIRIAIPDAILIPLALQASIPAIPLDRALTVIGSGPNVQLRMRTRTVEAIHAAILNVDGRVLLRDLSSSGVFINGNRVKEQILQNEDHVGIGKVVFQFMGIAPDVQEARSDSPRASLRGPSHQVTLDSPLVLIGRSNVCDLRLEAAGVDEKHAIIFAASGQHLIRQLDPAFKLIINGNDTRQSRLNEGDVIQFGDAELQYCAQDSASSAPIDAATQASDEVQPSPPKEAGDDDEVILQNYANDAPHEEFEAAQPPRVTAPPEQAEATGNVSASTRSRLRRIHSDDSPGRRVAELDIESVRDWGPLAVAMVKVQHVTAADEEFAPAQETPTANAPHGRSSRVWMLVGVAVIAVAGVGGWLLYRMS